MAGLRPIHDDDEYEDIEGEVIEEPQRSPRSLSKRASNQPDRMPAQPHVRIRKEGPFGLWKNKADQDHAERIQRIIRDVQLRDVAHQGHTTLDHRIGQRSVRAMDAFENDIVYPTERGSLAGALGEELAKDKFTRDREFNDQLMRGLDTKAMNIIDENP